MTDSLNRMSLKCRFGFHQMPKWEEPKQGTSSSVFDPTPRPAKVQSRTCERCGAVKVRFAR